MFVVQWVHQKDESAKRLTSVRAVRSTPYVDAAKGSARLERGHSLGSRVLETLRQPVWHRKFPEQSHAPRRAVGRWYVPTLLIPAASLISFAIRTE